MSKWHKRAREKRRQRDAKRPVQYAPAKPDLGVLAFVTDMERSLIAEITLPPPEVVLFRPPPPITIFQPSVTDLIKITPEQERQDELSVLHRDHPNKRN